MPPPARVDRRVAGRAMLLAPLAVLPLAVLAAGVLALGDAADLPSLATGLLVVGALALGTRALHWDGLSDVADGLTASYDRERSLAVMRTGTSGPAGTLVTVLVAGLQAVGFAALPAQPRGWLLGAVAVLVSRCALATACARPVPSARPDGLGATVAGTVPVLAAVVSWLLAAALLALASPDPVRAAAATLVAVVVVVVVLHRCARRLGGVTGDVLGACVELSLAALLLTV